MAGDTCAALELGPNHGCQNAGLAAAGLGKARKAAGPRPVPRRSRAERRWGRPQGQDEPPWARRLATRPDSPDCGCQGWSRLQGGGRSDALLYRPDFRRPEPGQGAREASAARRLAAGHRELGLCIKSRSAALANGIQGKPQFETKAYTVRVEMRGKPLPHGGWAPKTFQEEGKTPQARSAAQESRAAERRSGGRRAAV